MATVVFIVTLVGAPVQPDRLCERSGEIQAVIDRMRPLMGIRHEVALTIVPVNDRLVSVARSDEEDAFVLSFDRAFLNSLDEEELEAAVAHELGHVWIFTHHPFLQTEELANRRALKAVTRRSLAKVYSKVQQRHGVHLDRHALSR